ncbi:accessory Sec system protein translocase subunit SecY2 [Streptococcus sp. DD13]|uniref:accessory Sec system protein translocase subunit SecY2 n=1 Tax=Streptococcus sp. DD13 TaxID=1777881 RepID=UPI0008344781|nr:accessory Sec system protein translocase subunit SecY2 [Streptococcus sp. DD13]
MRFQSQISRRFFWTILFVFLYVLGSKIALPFVDLGKALNFGGNTTTALQLTSSVMGGNLRGMSIFSIGLSPWMSSMILWRMFSVSKYFNLDKVANAIVERRKMYLTFLLSVVQSLAIALYLPMKETGLPSMAVVLLHTLILIAGSYFLIWLADLNATQGFGGPVVIMMTGMVLYLPQDIMDALEVAGLSTYGLALLGLGALLFIYLAVIVEYAKYRIPINKIGIHNRLESYSYLDIKLNPAGGMPIMYAMNLVAVPQYLLLLVLAIDPQASWARSATQGLNMGEVPWFILYCVVIVLLAFAFAFINVNPSDISEKMIKNSEYISRVYPGRETRLYIQERLWCFALVGAIYLLLFAALPLVLLFWDQNLLRLSMLPGLFMIFNGMIYTIREEIKAMRVNRQYTKLF